MRSYSFATIGVLALLPCLAHAYTISSFPAGTYTGSGAAAQAAMDATLGITGFTIEDFEGGDPVALVAGLEISQNNSVPSGAYSPIAIGSVFVWDGTDGPFFNTQDGALTFHFTGGATSIGFGVAELDFAVNMLVNGVFIAALPTSNNVRGVYTRIDVGGGDANINTISLTSPQFDFVHFDHVAFLSEATIPEPTIAVLLGLGLAGLALRRN